MQEFILANKEENFKTSKKEFLYEILEIDKRNY